MNKQVELVATFDDLAQSKGIAEIRFQSDSSSYSQQKASLSYQLKAKVDAQEQPFLNGSEVTTHKTFELEDEAFQEFWDNEKELYQLVLEELGVQPSKIVKNTTTYDYQNPENNGTVSVEL